MKVYADLTKINGTKRTADISVVDCGYVRTYGNMVSLGYESSNGKHYELAIPREDLRRILNRIESESEQGNETSLF